MNSYNIKITVLSPLCIGNGQVMNNVSDYVKSNGKIHYINKHFIAHKLSMNSLLMNEYVNGIVYGMDNNKTHFNLKNFLEKKLKLTPQEYTQHTIDILSQDKEKEINCIIKTPDNNAYIPGSTLKGAIKTAFLYNWLINNDWSKRYLREINNYINLKNLENRLDEQYSNYNFSIQDSSPIPISQSKIIEIKRLSLKSGQTTIPQTWESITQESSCTTKIWNIKSVSSNWEDFCRIINKYTKDQNTREWDLLEDIGQNDKLSDDIYNSLYDFYDDIQDRMDSNNTAFLRIGNGKGYHHSSIGLDLYNKDFTKDKSNFLMLLNKKRLIKKGKANPKEFPATRNIDISEALPLGWIKLEKI